MTPDVDRLAALEAEVAELRAFVPMLARLQGFEGYSGRSILEHVWDIEEALDAARFLFDKVANGSDAASGDIRVTAETMDVEPEFRLPPEPG